MTDDNAAVLVFNHTTLEDTGRWMCRILVEGTNVQGPNGTVSPRIEVGNHVVSLDVAVVGESIIIN
jgi:hypothetical protein